ncbi:MAG: tRNA uridine-5-carboxymethylaminomethyl(34) synthesis GTPase MnmE [Rubrivivax sp.]|jgi:tRNA modification GTPase|nr:tRNA uridine-5-carboxymethylaminomethyl(34) synthesis GTPase MnmE [Rubrivivax sp.]
MSASAFSRRDDPILAITTAPGRGAVGIVRASGPSLQPLIAAVLRRPLRARHAHHGPFYDADGSVIDQGLALHFPAPHSYTGEEVLELQAHGGPVVLQLLLARCLAALPGARLAQPGEFTERAYLNHKLDLAQAEAVADLIDASTEAAARSASRSLAGAFSAQIDQLGEQVLRLRMLVEATLDFPEEDIDFLRASDAQAQLQRCQQRVQAVLLAARQGALLRDGLQVVIAGQPNVGKSSLLNALAGAELAIVTPIPGTTRDRVRESIQIDGVPIHVVDTAGLRDDDQASDEVERIGIARSWQSLGEADVVLWLHDLTRWDDAQYQRDDARIGERLAGARCLHVFNKADAVNVQALHKPLPADALCVSARAGEGLAALRQALLQHAGWQVLPEGSFLARARHVQALQATDTHLDAAAQHLQAPSPALELLAEELRLAHEALGAITGQMTADDVLGEIFGRFCIGK